MCLLRGFVFGLNLPLWTFCLLLILFVCPHVEGQVVVIGSPQPIKAAPGDSAILPCHLEPEYNVKGSTVEWSRKDLSGGYVHIYWIRPVAPDTMPAYAGRTMLFTDSLTTGNISLKILNVTLWDQGTYKCLVPRLKREAMVELLVDPKYAATPETTSDPTTPPPNRCNDNAASLRHHHFVWISVFVSFFLPILACGAAIMLRQKFHAQKIQETAADAPVKLLLV